MAAQKKSPVESREPSPLGKRVAWVTDTSGLSLEQFAARAGMTKGLLSQLRMGDNQDTGTSKAAKIAEVGGVDLRWLITGDGEPGRGSGWPEADAPPTAAGVAREPRVASTAPDDDPDAAFQFRDLVARYRAIADVVEDSRALGVEETVLTRAIVDNFGQEKGDGPTHEEVMRAVAKQKRQTERDRLDAGARRERLKALLDAEEESVSEPTPPAPTPPPKPKATFAEKNSRLEAEEKERKAAARKAKRGG